MASLIDRLEATSRRLKKGRDAWRRAASDDNMAAQVEVGDMCEGCRVQRRAHVL